MKNHQQIANNKFLHYQVPQVSPQSTQVQLIAQNGQLSTARSRTEAVFQWR